MALQRGAHLGKSPPLDEGDALADALATAQQIEQLRRRQAAFETIIARDDGTAGLQAREQIQGMGFDSHPLAGQARPASSTEAPRGTSTSIVAAAIGKGRSHSHQTEAALRPRIAASARAIAAPHRRQAPLRSFLPTKRLAKPCRPPGGRPKARFYNDCVDNSVLRSFLCP